MHQQSSLNQGRKLPPRPSWFLPHVVWFAAVRPSRDSSEWKKQGKKGAREIFSIINTNHFTLPSKYWLYLLRRWWPLLCSTCSLISRVTDPLGNGAGRVKELAFSTEWMIACINFLSWNEIYADTLGCWCCRMVYLSSSSANCACLWLLQGWE